MQVYSREHFKMVDLSSIAFNSMLLKAAQTQSCTQSNTFSDSDGSTVVGGLVLPVPPQLIAPGPGRKNYLLETDNNLLVTVEEVEFSQLMIIRIFDTTEFVYTLCLDAFGNPITYYFSGRRNSSRSGPIVVNPLGANWDALINWLNDYLKYGLLEDSLNDNQSSYIK